MEYVAWKSWCEAGIREVRSESRGEGFLEVVAESSRPVDRADTASWRRRGGEGATGGRAILLRQALAL